ncbi:MAG: DUF167 domain-containing protein [Planctomycetota bacterium]|jgi:hypothetical protein|nr:DUF167 domain-containing protein [Planctomycetota bacterium]MDP7131998.1 DUF167 domain-containing protein [Planctomycetota bacterium]MDP7252417.1 DUF167 domain-containing protein [Planctomycetota bacterium]
MESTFSGRETPDGYVLPILVVPGSSREKIVGAHGGRLKLAVQAPPEKGKANKAVIAFLAKALGVRKQQLNIVRGQSDRLKDILISDARADEIRKQLEPHLNS